MDLTKRRVCKCCDEIKIITDFKDYFNKGQRGYRHTCLKCFNKNRTGYNKKYYDNNRDKILQDAQNKRKLFKSPINQLSIDIMSHIPAN